MSRLITNAIRSTSASSDAITIDSAGKPAFPNGGVGKIIQVVSTTKTDTFSHTGSTSFVDVTGLSVSITPTNASNKILVFYDCTYGSTSGHTFFKLVRGSTDIKIGDAASNRIRSTFMMHNSGTFDDFRNINSGNIGEFTKKMQDL